MLFYENHLYRHLFYNGYHFSAGTYSKGALFSRDPYYKGSQKPFSFIDLFGRGSAMWIVSIRNLISLFSTKIYSVGLCSTMIHSIRIYFKGDLFFKDQFYIGIHSIRDLRSPLSCGNLHYRGSILWGSIL